MKKRKFPIKTEKLSLTNFQHDWFIAYCLLVADSERFIIRTCTPFKSKVVNRHLIAQLNACFYQEAQHALSHEQFTKHFTENRSVLKWAIRLVSFLNYQVLNAFLPSRLKLAIAAAMEQLNTALSCSGLVWLHTLPASNNFSNMLKWHFVEEIEHREVVYDLMQEIKISSNQKTIASLMAFSSFCFWITLVSLILRLSQSPRPLLDPIYWKSQGEGLPFLRMLRAASVFTRKNYHPAQDPLSVLFHEAVLEIQIYELKQNVPHGSLP